MKSCPDGQLLFLPQVSRPFDIVALGEQQSPMWLA